MLRALMMAQSMPIARLAEWVVIVLAIVSLGWIALKNSDIPWKGPITQALGILLIAVVLIFAIRFVAGL